MNVHLKLHLKKIVAHMHGDYGQAVIQKIIGIEIFTCVK